MKIAIIGSGISGLTAAYYLHQQHEITVFEKADRIGGHTATIDVTCDGQQYAIDTGFIVFNDWTYPNFIKLLDELGVKYQNTQMSFSVSCRETGLEYAGSNLNTLFAQRRNLFSPYFLKMIRDILRFNREAEDDLTHGWIDQDKTLGSYLLDNGYSKGFILHYLIPMGAAIWSASSEDIMDFPLHFFVRFFKNHGLLNIKDRPQWKTIVGGSREYLQPLTAGFSDRIQLNTNIRSVIRKPSGVEIIMANGTIHSFDQVVFACHSDQAMALLADVSSQEKLTLKAIPYRSNEVILHTDTSLLPTRKKAWSSWNYMMDHLEQQKPTLTYNMNILQNIQSDQTFCVTLNKTDQINPDKILGSFNYSHPQFSLEGMAAQQRWQEINGNNRTWFCGAYWRNGFHEDGVVSALNVVEGINKATEKLSVAA